MTHCEEFNECLKSKNWVELCGRSHDIFNSIDKISWRDYTIYLPYVHFVGESGYTCGYTFPHSAITILSK